MRLRAAKARENKKTPLAALSLALFAHKTQLPPTHFMRQQQHVAYVPRTKSEEDLAIALALSASLAPGVFSNSLDT